MVPLDRDSRCNTCGFPLVEGGDRSWSPVVYAADFASQATLEEFSVLAEIVQQAGKSRFLAGAEDCGVFRGAVRDGREMFAKWLGAARAVCAVRKSFDLFRH
jgi:hypothetical protein